MEEIKQMIMGPGPDPLSRIGLRTRMDSLAVLSMALSLSSLASDPRTSPDLMLSMLPSYKYKEPWVKTCSVCGKSCPDGKEFCSAKHATLYYQNQKASGVYKGDRKLPRSKRKKK